MGSEVVQEDFFERSGAQSSGSDGSFSPSPDTSDQFAVRSPSEKEISAMLRVPSENVRNGFPGSIERVKGYCYPERSQLSRQTKRRADSPDPTRQRQCPL